MSKRQMEIAGTEKPKIPELEAAAEAYVAMRDKRMKLTEEEVEKRDQLAGLMKKHNLTFYEDLNAVPPLVVTLKVGEPKVKVKKLDGSGEDDDE